jgi:hypothetical protein
VRYDPRLEQPELHSRRGSMIVALSIGVDAVHISGSRIGRGSKSLLFRSCRPAIRSGSMGKKSIGGRSRKSRTATWLTRSHGISS